jgi:hypothetical protein
MNDGAKSGIFLSLLSLQSLMSLLAASEAGPSSRAWRGPYIQSA